MEKSLEDIRHTLLQFREERDWKTYHDPKNLAEAISIEASELLEIFLWKSNVQSRDLSEKEMKRIKEEVADIFIFLIYMCEELKIPLLDEVMAKIEVNRTKYPADISRGTSKKYTEL